MTAASHIALRRDEIIFAVLDELSRHRALRPAESELMEAAMRRLENKRDYWQWTPEEDAAVRALLVRRYSRARRLRLASAAKREFHPKLITATAEIAALAAALERSYGSVLRRVDRLAKGQCKRRPAKPQMFRGEDDRAALDSGDGRHRNSLPETPAGRSQETARRCAAGSA